VSRLWPGIAALVAVAIFGLINLDRLPAEMATHWNLRGEPDGWSAPLTAVLLLPGLGLVLAGLLAFLPRIDPKRANFPLHEKAWWLLSNTALLFMAILNLFVIGTNLGWPVRIEQVLGIGVGVLFLVLGNYLTRVRQNWFMGIRTPWTLSSERSWRETHRIGGRLFMLAGLFLVVATLVNKRLPTWVILVAAAVPALIAVVVSYREWRADQPARDGVS
jgi:uncharacterized membrane protein